MREVKVPREEKPREKEGEEKEEEEEEEQVRGYWHCAKPLNDSVHSLSLIILTTSWSPYYNSHFIDEKIEI